jgi:hypothetical protein
MVIDRAETIAAADAAGLFLLALDPDGFGEQDYALPEFNQAETSP